jgi:hypothetical protein
MLAANLHLMKPYPDKIKTYPIIFIGAGGHVLEAGSKSVFGLSVKQC